MSFHDDNEFQLKMRDLLLKPFYKKNGFEERFVFTDKGSLAEHFQKVLSVDTILQKEENRVLGIEEKIIRWRENDVPLTAFAFETWSCTNKGYEKQGWMYTAQCDLLFVCFVQKDQKSIIGYMIPFPELKKWFFENDRFTHYYEHIEPYKNRTACRIVLIDHVMKAIPSTKKVFIEAE